MKRLARTILRSAGRPLKRAVKSVAFRGNARFCPICGKSARVFQPYGIKRRQDVRCPFCGSLERHRLLWRYLQGKTDFFQVSGVRMLHVAAEPFFEQRFRRQIGDGYLTADLMLPADVTIDVTDIPYPDETFDILFCSHVLEHVPDDRQAMREMYRVLKPGGWAITLVPITVDRTIEDLSITDPQERLRLYGQSDHVRRYGLDFCDRLEEAGFVVRITKSEDFIAGDEISRLRLGGDSAGEVFHCTKGVPA